LWDVAPQIQEHETWGKAKEIEIERKRKIGLLQETKRRNDERASERERERETRERERPERSR